MLASVELQRLAPGDRTLHFFSTLWDPSLFEILAPLVAGATVVVHPDPRGETPDGFLEFAEARSLTVATHPVGFLHELAEELLRTGRTLPAGLRLILTGGESPSGARVQSLLRAAGGPFTVVNAYGPTEAVILATAHMAERAEEAVGPLPIGRPLQN